MRSRAGLPRAPRAKAERASRLGIRLPRSLRGASHDRGSGAGASASSLDAGPSLVPAPMGLLSDRRAGEARQGGEEFVLEPRVEDCRVWRAAPLVVPVAAAGAGLGGVAGGKPRLSQVPEPEVV